MNLSILETPGQKQVVKGFLAKAMAYHQRGELNKAERLYRRALKVEPNNIDALHLSGLVAHQSGRNTRAVKLIRRAINNDNSHAVFYINLAAIYNKMQQWSEAEAAVLKFLELSPENSGGWEGLGQALAGLGKIAPAVKALKRSISLSPDNPLLYCNLATLLVTLGRLEEAEVACRSALDLQPSLAKAFHGLGVAQSSLGKFEEAVENFDRAHKLEPLNEQTIINLASVFSSQMKYDEAINLFNEVLRNNPHSSEAYLNLGICLSEKGELERAIECFRRVIEIDKNNVDAYYALAASGRISFEPTQLYYLRELLASPAVPNKAKIKANFALAWQADAQELPIPAMTYCRAGNNLHRSISEKNGHKYDSTAHEALGERIQAVFTQNFFNDRVDFGSDSDLPVFIVGMPRSGTTLVEQIMSSHSEIWGAGERSDIPQIVENLENRSNPLISFPKVIEDLEKKECARLANAHLRELRDLSASIRIVDKMPLNYLYLGFIALLYPKAKIIHCERDPRDLAISCYFQNFVLPHGWSHDLDHIEAYLHTYYRIMTHWHQVLPLSILDLRYEDLINNQEGKSRDIIDFVGLEWDRSCLDFHTSESAVRTASKWQVREPIYKRSVGKWKVYEDYLSPSLIAFGQATFDRS